MIKYPKIFHLPFSAGISRDDKVLKSVDHFFNQDIIVTEKIDGSNVSLDRFGCYSRSTKNPSHPSFNALKSFHAILKPNLWANHQYFGEWCYAKHSIKYNSLPAYFLLFGILSMELKPELPLYWASWEYTITHLKKLNASYGLDIHTVPVLFEGKVHNANELEQLALSLTTEPSCYGAEEKEGVVIRLAQEFRHKDFTRSIAKFVRANHVQTDTHWKHKNIIRNSLKG